MEKHLTSQLPRAPTLSLSNTVTEEQGKKKVLFFNLKSNSPVNLSPAFADQQDNGTKSRYGAVDPAPPISLLSCPCWTNVPHVLHPCVGSFLKGPKGWWPEFVTSLIQPVLGASHPNADRMVPSMG